MKTEQLLWKPVWELLKWLNRELPRGPAIPLLDLPPRDMETCPRKDLCTNVRAALFMMAEQRRRPTCLRAGRGT